MKTSQLEKILKNKMNEAIKEKQKTEEFLRYNPRSSGFIQTASRGLLFQSGKIAGLREAWDIVKKSALTALITVLLTTQCYAQDIDWSKWYPNTPERIERLANAIYWAENSKKYPYGIISINTHGNEKLARRICKNTIKNQIKRWNRKEPYIVSLRNRYAPIGAGNDPKGYNANWIRNVKYFYELNKGVK